MFVFEKAPYGTLFKAQDKADHLLNIQVERGYRLDYNAQNEKGKFC